MKNFFIFLLALGFLSFSSCTRTANRTGPLTPYPEVTADIQIGEEVRGEGTRAELLGFIRWGDPGRASFRAHPQEIKSGGVVDALTGGVVKQSMQSAVYDALEGQPDNFIVDPHFHTIEHNFLLFRTARTKVVGRKAKHVNYRQVKRFNTDQTETLPLEEAPQTYTVERGGRPSTKVTTSGNITADLTDSVQVYETSDGVEILDVDIPQNSSDASIDALENKLQMLNQRIDALR